MKAKARRRAVVVTTTTGGVHFGHTTEDGRGDTIALTDARNAYYWKVAPGTGVAELANTGPVVGSKIGTAAANVVLRNVSRVYTCSADAVQAWESARWK